MSEPQMPTNQEVTTSQEVMSVERRISAADIVAAFAKGNPVLALIQARDAQRDAAKDAEVAEKDKEIYELLAYKGNAIGARNALEKGGIASTYPGGIPRDLQDMASDAVAEIAKLRKRVEELEFWIQKDCPDELPERHDSSNYDDREVTAVRRAQYWLCAKVGLRPEVAND